jgi:hypothetical protein
MGVTDALGPLLGPGLVPTNFKRSILRELTMAVAGCNYFTITSSLTIKFNSARVDLFLLKRFNLRFSNYFTITSSLTMKFNSARVDLSLLKRFDLRFMISIGRDHLSHQLGPKSW